MGVSTVHKCVHDQPVASSEWTVVHNLNTLAPIVDVMIDISGGLQKILPLDTVVVNNSTIVVKFSSPRTGKVSVA